MQTERDASDRTTSELLSVVLGVADVTAADLERIAIAIDSGQLARPALAPDQPRRLSELPPAVADVLTAVFELARRSALAAPPVAIRGPADVALIARRELGGRARECVLAIVCDATNRVLRTVIVTRGSADTASVPVREILNSVLRYDGRSFAIAHNHPAGVVEPTDADVRTTERIAAAARVVGLRFLGHVVVAGDDWLAVASRATRILGSAVTEQSLPDAHPT